MINPEADTGTEAIDQSPVETELPPLTEEEQAALAREYAIPEPSTVEAVGPSLTSELERLNNFCDDPAEFGAELARRVGETFHDQVAGEILIRPSHVETMDEVRADIGQAVGLLKTGGSPESISRLVGTAWEKSETLPSAMRPVIQKIMTRYYEKNDPKNQ